MNQLSGYDVLTRHTFLCIILGMTSLHVMHVSNCTVVDMAVGNANLYIVLARSSSYFRVTERCWLLDICPGLEFLWVNILAGPSKKMSVSEVLHKLLQENEYSNISESEYSSDSKINVKISSLWEHSRDDKWVNVSGCISRCNRMLAICAYLTAIEFTQIGLIKCNKGAMTQLNSWMILC
jgi:hypothetical protein